MPYPVIPISRSCVRGAAGVQALYLIDGDNVQGLQFNLLDRVEQIALAAGTSLIKCEFDIGSASFSQTLSRSQNWPRVTQKVTFEHDGLANQVLRAIKRLGEHCNVHIIVHTVQGQYFYMGISYYADRGYLWDSGNCSLQAGSAKVDQVGGQVRMSSTLQAITRQYAPEVIADVSVLPIELPPPPDPELDLAPPVALVFIPADDAVGVSITPTIKIIFNEAVKAGGAGTLEVRNYDTDALVIAFNIANPVQALFDQVEWSMTIQAQPLLSYSTHYYITVTAGAVTDQAGNAWAGVSSKDDWDFYTGAVPDTTAPTLVSLTPADDATGVDPAGLTASIQLDEDIAAGTGNFLLYRYSDDSLLASIDVNMATIAGDTATVDIATYVTTGEHYYILVPAGVLTDLAGNAYAGLLAKEDWDFETQAGAPAPTGYFPALASTDNSNTTAMYIDVSVPMQLGSSGIIKLVRYIDGTGPTDEGGSDVVHHTWDVATTGDITFTNGGLRINFTNAPTLAFTSLYYFVIPTGAIEDAQSNSLPDHHLTGTPSASWFFTVASQLTATLVPATGGSTSCRNVPLLHTGYGRTMGWNKAWVKVFDYDTDELIWFDSFFTAQDIPSWQGQTAGTPFGDIDSAYAIVDGDDVKLFNLPIQAGQRVYVIFEAEALVDNVHGTEIAGLPKVKGDWEFTFTSAGMLSGIPFVSRSPETGENFAILEEGDSGHIPFTVQLNEHMHATDMWMNPERKFIRFHDFTTGTVVASIPAGNRRACWINQDNLGTEGSDYWKFILPEGALSAAGKYYITIDAGFWVTRCGGSSPAVPALDWIIEGADYIEPDDQFDYSFDMPLG